MNGIETELRRRLVQLIAESLFSHWSADMATKQDLVNVVNELKKAAAANQAAIADLKQRLAVAEASAGSVDDAVVSGIQDVTATLNTVDAPAP